MQPISASLPSVPASRPHGQAAGAQGAAAAAFLPAPHRTSPPRCTAPHRTARARRAAARGKDGRSQGLARGGTGAALFGTRQQNPLGQAIAVRRCLKRGRAAASALPWVGAFALESQGRGACTQTRRCRTGTEGRVLT